MFGFANFLLLALFAAAVFALIFALARGPHYNSNVLRLILLIIMR